MTAIRGRKRRSQPTKSQQDRCLPRRAAQAANPAPWPFPRRRTTDEAPPPPKPKKPTDNPQYSLHVDVPVVTVDARVVQKDGRPAGLAAEQVAKEHFKVFEDGVPQQIQSVTMSKAPITAVLLVEFAATNYNFMYDALNASYAFASNLQPQDWVAIEEFDMKTHILLDFTQDKQAVFGALNRCGSPASARPTSWMPCIDTLDRLDRIPGHKELVVVASGRDTFSKIIYDTILKKVKATPNVTIYTICTGEAYLQRVDAMAGSNPNVSAGPDGLLAGQEPDGHLRSPDRRTDGTLRASWARCRTFSARSRRPFATNTPSPTSRPIPSRTAPIAN